MYFKDIIGQEEIKKRLIHSAQTGVVPHAQLFTEQGGAGAFPLTLAYARYLNCTNRMETDSCGHCPSCLKYNEVAHLGTLLYSQGATTLKTDAEKAKVEFKEAKEYLEKLIPLLSPSKPAQKKMIDNANTMLNFINTQL